MNPSLFEFDLDWLDLHGREQMMLTMTAYSNGNEAVIPTSRTDPVVLVFKSDGC